MPRVSVVVPNYNHRRFLERRIQSILEQTYQNFELILLDDASTDDSREVLERYRSDPRVTIVVNDTNSGSPFPQWNRGINLARGEFVWIAEADDDADPEMLGILVRELEQHPRAVLAYCQSWMIDAQGERLHLVRAWTDRVDPERWNTQYCNDGREEARRYLVFQNTVPNASAVVLRRSSYLEVGGAPEAMRLCGDWMLWSRLAAKGEVIFVPQALNRFREHGGTVRSSTPNERRLRESLEVIAEIHETLGIPPELRRKVAASLLEQWRVEYRLYPHPVDARSIARVGSFVYRLDAANGLKFFGFFFIRAALGPRGLAPARKVWEFLRTRARRASRSRMSH